MSQPARPTARRRSGRRRGRPPSRRRPAKPRRRRGKHVPCGARSRLVRHDGVHDARPGGRHSTQPGGRQKPRAIFQKTKRASWTALKPPPSIAVRTGTWATACPPRFMLASSFPYTIADPFELSSARRSQITADRDLRARARALVSNNPRRILQPAPTWQTAPPHAQNRSRSSRQSNRPPIRCTSQHTTILHVPSIISTGSPTACPGCPKTSQKRGQT